MMDIVKMGRCRVRGKIQGSTGDHWKQEKRIKKEPKGIKLQE